MRIAEVSELETLPRLLGIAFAVSWGVAAVHPWDGVGMLAVAGCSLTLPYFFVSLGKRVVQNLLVYLCLIVAGVAFPPLWPLAAIWILICLVMKLGLMLYNLPLIFLGVIIYLMTACLPHALLVAGLTFFDEDWRAVLVVLIALLGAGLFLLLMGLLRKFRCDTTRGAAFAFGFCSYLMLLLLTFLLPGGHGGSGDGA